MNGEAAPVTGGVGDFEYFTEDEEEELSFWKRKRRQVRRSRNRYNRKAHHALVNS